MMGVTYIEIPTFSPPNYTKQQEQINPHESHTFSLTQNSEHFKFQLPVSSKIKTNFFFKDQF